MLLLLSLPKTDGAYYHGDIGCFFWSGDAGEVSAGGRKGIFPGNLYSPLSVRLGPWAGGVDGEEGRFLSLPLFAIQY